MWPYWILFLIPAFVASTEYTRGGQRMEVKSHRWTLGWIAATFFLALMVGYRFEVGGDWDNYFELLDEVAGQSLADVFTSREPGYRLLNWISIQLGGDVVLVNAMGGVIFAVALAVFCRSLRRPWLALTVAVPYLVIVVGMGYSRQGIALSLAMLGLLALQRRSVWKFVFWVVLGATFHRTAVLLLPIGGLVQSRGRMVKLMWVSATTAVAYFVLLADSAETLYAGYVEAEYQSEGALVRLLMNAVPAAILLLRWKRLRTLPGAGIWLGFAVLSLGLLVLLFLTPASTAVDRVALYMLPLQLVVFSALPDLFTQKEGARRQLTVAIVVYYGCVLFVWLMFATHSRYWVPYRFYPLQFAS